MNKKQKTGVILSALAGIAVAGSLIAGSTYAIFTSNSETDIAVNSGKIDVRATMSDLELYSPKLISTDGTIIDSSDVAGSSSFYNGGSATLDGNKITLSKMTPGDSVSFKINLKNYSNVLAQYRAVISFDEEEEADEKYLKDALSIDLGNNNGKLFVEDGKKVTRWEFVEAASDSENGENVPYSDEWSWTVSLPADEGNDYQDKSCSITFAVEAIQGNAKTYFYGGRGTEEDPYIIKDAASFKAMNYYADSYRYYKIGDDVETLDLTNVGKVYMYGEFDGNNKTISANQSIFQQVGYYDASADTFSEKSVVKNLTANLNTGGDAMVFQIAAKDVSFDNVKVSGRIEGNWNIAAFVSYGTTNVLEENGAEGSTGVGYALNFTNCSCDASLYSKKLASAAILIAHTYSGGAVTINLDEATNDAIDEAKVYTVKSDTNNGKKYKYYIMGSSTTAVYVGGSKVAQNNGSSDAIIIETTTPSKNAETSDYELVTSSTASKVLVQLAASLSAYESDNVTEIGDYSGITNVFSKKTYESTNSDFTPENSLTVFKKISSVTIKNGLSDTGHPAYSYDDSDAALTLITNTTVNYLTGTVSIIVTQYDSDNNVLSAGSINIASKANPTDTWTIA